MSTDLLHPGEKGNNQTSRQGFSTYNTRTTDGTQEIQNFQKSIF